MKTAQERSEMFDRALKLNAVDRAELRARKGVREFMASKWAPPVVVVAAYAAVNNAMGVVEVLVP